MRSQISERWECRSKSLILRASRNKGVLISVTDYLSSLRFDEPEELPEVEP